LLFDARDGSPLHVFDKGPGAVGHKSERNYRYLVSSAAARREPGSVRASFPYVAFEEAVLSLLKEIDPREVLGQQTEPDELLVLSGELSAVEAAIAALEADLDDHGESPRLFKRLREREAQQRELAEKVSQARARAAHPLSESWGDAQSLLATL